MLVHILARGCFPHWIWILGDKRRRIGLKNPLDGANPKSLKVDVTIWRVVLRGA